MRIYALIAPLALALPAGAASPMLGFNYPLWSNDGYAGAPAAQALKDLAATGAGWVALTPTLYVKNRGDAEIAATRRSPRRPRRPATTPCAPRSAPRAPRACRSR